MTVETVCEIDTRAVSRVRADKSFSAAQAAQQIKIASTTAVIQNPTIITVISSFTAEGTFETVSYTTALVQGRIALQEPNSPRTDNEGEEEQREIDREEAEDRELLSDDDVQDWWETRSEAGS